MLLSHSRCCDWHLKLAGQSMGVQPRQQLPPTFISPAVVTSPRAIRKDTLEGAALRLRPLCAVRLTCEKPGPEDLGMHEQAVHIGKQPASQNTHR